MVPTVGTDNWTFVLASIVRSRYATLEEADPGGALSKLSQNGTVKDYQVQFEWLSNRTIGLPESFLFPLGLHEELKVNVQILKPVTLTHAFELAKLQEQAHTVITKQTTVVADQTTPRSSKGLCFNCDAKILNSYYWTLMYLRIIITTLAVHQI
ncbi:hypothetical protein Dsin_018243 [Dipteronia sinensis]|uniref:Retrotransposon gag domain-containing protein n=1 Tax=Dipteronia sinensis TaxID=43782 RepID=A0AAE0A503_9ROSI|nr:hypothetical protein Dsin_018243 [Dipteronia sinensis]